MRKRQEERAEAWMEVLNEKVAEVLESDGSVCISTSEKEVDEAVKERLLSINVAQEGGCGAVEEKLKLPFGGGVVSGQEDGS